MMSTGKVKRFDVVRHYGFIVQDDGRDIFFHQNDVLGRRILREGQAVEFEVVQTPKGPKAVNVRPRGEALA
jgi:CspA family cold shock protein